MIEVQVRTEPNGVSVIFIPEKHAVLFPKEYKALGFELVPEDYGDEVELTEEDLRANEGDRLYDQQKEDT